MLFSFATAPREVRSAAQIQPAQRRDSPLLRAWSFVLGASVVGATVLQPEPAAPKASRKSRCRPTGNLQHTTYNGLAFECRVHRTAWCTTSHSYDVQLHQLPMRR
jgi:hypothetical protein